MSRVVRASLLAGAATFAAVSGLHLYWAAGDHESSSAVIPSRDGTPLFVPTRAQTIGVAVLTATASAMYAGTAKGRSPRWLFRLGTAGAGGVLLARAIGNGSSVGITKTINDTDFARRDTALYTPLCAALGLIGVAGGVRA